MESLKALATPLAGAIIAILSLAVAVMGIALTILGLWINALQLRVAQLEQHKTDTARAEAALLDEWKAYDARLNQQPEYLAHAYRVALIREFMNVKDPAGRVPLVARMNALKSHVSPDDWKRAEEEAKAPPGWNPKREGPESIGRTKPPYRWHPAPLIGAKKEEASP